MENLAVARLSPKFVPVQTASFGDDSGIYATFDDDFVKNEFQSEMQGRAVFDHYFVIELQYPGDSTKTFKYRFSETEAERGNQWTNRFAKQWSAFRNAKEQTPDGTPIEMWPPLDKKRVFELKANRIFTIEQIAAMTDATGPNLGMDWRKLRDQAQAFLNPAVSTVQVSKLTRENEDLQDRLRIMEQQVSVLSQGRSFSENVTALDAPKRRGPKPKIQSTEQE